MKNNNFNKYILSVIFVLLFDTLAFSQVVVSTDTYYSKTQNGSIVKENESFTLGFGLYKESNKAQMIKFNSQGSIKWEYGPLYLNNTSLTNEGFYEEYFAPEPMEVWQQRKEFIAYRIAYDKKGGKLLFITELRKINNQPSYKIYYTNEGYDRVISTSKSSSSNYELKENNFDVNDVVINSTTLNQIMSKINFSFEQDGQKQVSDDGQYVTVRYKNNSLIKPLITYTKGGDVTQIIFIMPISNVINIWQELVKRFGTKYEDGNEVVKRGQLTYLAKEDSDNVGILGIYIE